jgi:LytS/YehU family sensor histidine kinase
VIENYFILLAMLLVIVLSIIRIRHKDRAAKMFLIVFLIPTITTIINQLSLLRLIETNVFVSNSLQTGMGLAAIGFSVAIGAQVRQIRNERYKAEINTIENKMKALLSQMNPHFIFNSLHSIKMYIEGKDETEAQKYIDKFSKVMRNVLEYSQQESITLDKELSFLETYMQLEQTRLPFTYTIHIDKNVNSEETEIPPLILQPFIENSIKHGIAALHDNGKINIHIAEKEDYLVCCIEDNGIGRQVSSMQKQDEAKYTSYAMKSVQQRLDALNALKGTDAKYIITDLYDAQNKPLGTKIEVYLPL